MLVRRGAWSVGLGMPLGWATNEEQQQGLVPEEGFQTPFLGDAVSHEEGALFFKMDSTLHDIARRCVVMMTCDSE